jgi:hypothetical protein
VVIVKILAKTILYYYTVPLLTILTASGSVGLERHPVKHDRAFKSHPVECLIPLVSYTLSRPNRPAEVALVPRVRRAYTVHHPLQQFGFVASVPVRETVHGTMHAPVAVVQMPQNQR